MFPVPGTSSTRPTRRRQAGAALLEHLFAAVIIAGGLGMLSVLSFEQSSDTKDAVVAQQTRTVLDATKAYVEANFAAVETNAQAAANRIIEIPVSTIQAANYLAPTFQNTNAYGQSYTTFVRWLANNRLEVIVPSRNGVAIPEGRVPRIAALIGSNGGYVASSSLARGAQGAWQMNITPYQTAGAGLATGRVLATQFYADGQLIADYLYRNQVPGMPEANRMYTAIDMNGNNIASAATIGATTVNATTVNATNVAASATVSGNVVQAASHVRIGNQNIDQTRAAMINDLYAGTYGANGGDLAIGRNLDLGRNLDVTRDAAIGRNLVVGGTLAVAGATTLSGTLTAAQGVRPGAIAADGAACTPNGTIATSTANDLFICKADRWRPIGSRGVLTAWSPGDGIPSVRSVVACYVNWYGGRWLAANGHGVTLEPSGDPAFPFQLYGVGGDNLCRRMLIEE